MRKLWVSLIAVIAMLTSFISATTPASADADIIGSIFDSSAPAVANAGWAQCADPVTYGIDDSRLRPRQRQREQARIHRALTAWGSVTGLQFSFTGSERLAYDERSTQLRNVDGSAPARRHIDFAFLPRSVSTVLSGNGLGFGGPSAVDTSTREILGGKVILRLDHVRRNSASAPRELASLYLHELGHVMGLTHATQSSDLMAPIVTTNTTISDLDVRSVSVLMKPCAV